MNNWFRKSKKKEDVDKKMIDDLHHSIHNLQRAIKNIEETDGDSAHAEIVLLFNEVMSQGNASKNAIDYGQTVTSMGGDKITNGGFWLWQIDDNIEYYSPSFYNALGYEDQEFPYHASEWQSRITKKDLAVAMYNFTKHIQTGGDHPYYQVVNFHKKDGTIIPILCSGSIVQNGVRDYLVGTHILL